MTSPDRHRRPLGDHPIIVTLIALAAIATIAEFIFGLAGVM